MLGSVRCLGVKEQGVAGLKRIGLIGMAISHRAFEHINKLDALMTKDRVSVGTLIKRH